jgi:hypothetical protein
MQIAIITRHAITNYGSILQAYALQKVLEAMGHSITIIDYIRQDEDYRHITGTLLRRSKSWNRNAVSKAVYKAIIAPEYRKAGRRFEAFRKELLNLSRRYSSATELQNDKPWADIYCTGSDQVWGPIGAQSYDPAYFLSFTGDQDRRIAYAGSFGSTEFEPDILLAYGKYLGRYDSVSVRESSAVPIVKGFGLPNVFQVLDPTLLVTSEEWGRLIEKDIQGGYVLIYQVHSNPRMDAYAKAFAGEVGLPLIRLSTSLHQITRGGRLVYLPEPWVFLSYIKNARYLITDSFHGTAFAINFGTQFIDVLPSQTQTRNLSILHLLGLDDRVLTDYMDLSFAHRQIDFIPVRRHLSQERSSSLNALEKMIAMTREAV